MLFFVILLSIKGLIWLTWCHPSFFSACLNSLPHTGDTGLKLLTCFDHLKSQCHEIESLYALIVWFQKIFTIPYTIINFLYLLLWNYILILKMLTETLLRIPFSVIGWCSLYCRPLAASINLSQVASGMALQIHRGRLPVNIFNVKIAGLGSLKRVTERIFKLVSNFKEAS